MAENQKTLAGMLKAKDVIGASDHKEKSNKNRLIVNKEKKSGGKRK